MEGPGGTTDGPRTRSRTIDTRRSGRCGAGGIAAPLAHFALVGIMALGAAGCDPGADVDILPLPPLERPSPEARAGLPEIQGVWQFAGWEVVRGDSTALERTFPSFGDLDLEVQRLDSLAGSFATAGGVTEVVGEVRRDGWVALAALNDEAPVAFISGRFSRDTLWLELTSILPPDEWPQNSRAAFVRQSPAGPLAWVRGMPRVSPLAMTDSTVPGSFEADAAPTPPGDAAPSASVPAASSPAQGPSVSPAPSTRSAGSAPPPPPPPAAPPPPPPPPPAVEQPAETENPEELAEPEESAEPEEAEVPDEPVEQERPQEEDEELTEEPAEPEDRGPPALLGTPIDEGP